MHIDIQVRLQSCVYTQRNIMAHSHTHIHMHVYLSVYLSIHTYIHTYVCMYCGYINLHVHVHPHGKTHVHVIIGMHLLLYTCSYSFTYPCACICITAYISFHIFTCVYTSKYRYTIYTYIYMCIQTPACRRAEAYAHMHTYSFMHFCIHTCTDLGRSTAWTPTHTYTY